MIYGPPFDWIVSPLIARNKLAELATLVLEGFGAAGCNSTFAVFLHLNDIFGLGT